MVFENCHATDTATISGSCTGIIIGFAATSVYARVYNCTSFAKSPSGSSKNTGVVTNTVHVTDMAKLSASY